MKNYPKSARISSKSALSALKRVLGDFTRTGGEYNFECPFCESSGNSVIGHLHVSLKKGKALCHKCGYGAGVLIKLFYDLGIDDPDLFVAIPTKIKTFLNDVFYKDDSSDSVEPVELPKGYTALSINSKDIVDKLFLTYLKRYRGVTDKEMSLIPMGYTVSGQYSGRLIFPVYMHGKFVYFTSRSVIAGKPKSLHPGTSKKYVVYGLDWLVDTSHVFIVEGVFDTFAFPGRSLAVLGHFITPQQAEVLRRLDAREFTICFDSDVPIEVIRRTCRYLSTQTESTVSFIELEHGDPFDNRHTIDRYIRRRIVYNQGQAMRNKLEEVFENGRKFR